MVDATFGYFQLIACLLGFIVVLDQLIGRSSRRVFPALVREGGHAGVCFMASRHCIHVRTPTDTSHRGLHVFVFTHQPPPSLLLPHRPPPPLPVSSPLRPRADIAPCFRRDYQRRLVRLAQQIGYVGQVSCKLWC